MGKRILKYDEVYNSIKDNIQNDYLQANTKLESIRQYAKKHNVSTTTVEKAYNQLLVEGYIYSKPRSGFFVMDLEKIRTEAIKEMLPAIPYHLHKNDQITRDMFDLTEYKRVTNMILNNEQDQLLTVCHPSGETELKSQIRSFLIEERNVHCDINQIIIGAGIQPLLHILLSLIKKDKVMFLEPAFTKAIRIFKQYDYALIGCDDFSELLSKKADFLYISPSNMYPSGEILKVSDRNKLIYWANQNDSYIIEDDYNYVLRYNSQVIPAIQSFDSSSVIYMGSFSKTLLPSLRMSYMVLPPKLYKVYLENFSKHAQSVSKLEQLTVAKYMATGLYKKHLKKLSKYYKEKNEIILNAIAPYLNDSLSIRSTDSNLHIVFDFKNKTQFNHFIKACKTYQFKYKVIHKSSSIIFPYSGLENDTIPTIIQSLLKIPTTS